MKTSRSSLSVSHWLETGSHSKLSEISWCLHSRDETNLLHTFIFKLSWKSYLRSCLFIHFAYFPADTLVVEAGLHPVTLCVDVPYKLTTEFMLYVEPFRASMLKCATVSTRLSLILLVMFPLSCIFKGEVNSLTFGSSGQTETFLFVK